MQQKTGTCKSCHRYRPINSKELCGDCQYLVTHGKTRFEAIIEKEKLKQVKPLTKRKSVKKPSKNKENYGDLEREVFEQIWEEREHVCSNLNCNKYLGDEIKRQYFSHRRTKRSAPELRLEKSNIDLLCLECHHNYEFGDRTKMNIKS